VFVSVSAFKPKVKNVSPRRGQSPLPYYYYYHHRRRNYYYCCFSWGRVMYKLSAFLECPYKSVVEDFNWQNCTTHKAALYVELYKRWTMSLQPSQLSLRYSVPSK
jgi:hypothetical protein